MPYLQSTGPLSVAIKALRELLANVPFFQVWTGTNVTTALKRIFIGEVGYPLTSFSIAAGVATFGTREVHGIEAGDVITIAGAALGAESTHALDGPYTVASVTTSSFTAATAAGDVGIQYVDGVFVLPSVRPIAVVSEDTDSLQGNVIGTGGAAIFSGSCQLYIEADVSRLYQNDQKNAAIEARNAFGSIIAGLSLTQGTLDLMCLNKVETLEDPKFIPKSAQNDNAIRFERWAAMIRVTWGLES